MSPSRPPYEDDGEFWADQPRRAGRVALTLVGLPASYEVAILANVIHQLRTQLERAFSIQITEAVFTASHLMALYKDDLQDLAAHLKLRYMRPRREFHPLVWETSSAYAGYGRGLCKAWHNNTECWLEEGREMPDISLLSVHYSHTALTVALAEIGGAGGLWEPEYRHLENFTLGRDALDDYTQEEDYWEDVRKHLLFIMVEYGFRNPQLIMITGDAADGKFMEHLKSTMLGHMGKVPDIISDDPIFAAAKGAAEFMRRGPLEPWSKQAQRSGVLCHHHHLVPPGLPLFPLLFSPLSLSLVSRQYIIGL